MSFLDTVRTRQRTILKGGDSAMYRLHPDLRYREIVYSPLGVTTGTRAAATYSTHQWVFRAVWLRATAVASVQLRLVGDGGREADNPFARPNGAQGASEFWREWQTVLDLYGEVYIEIVSDRRGRPAEFWVRGPEEITPVFADDAGARAYRIVTGYALAHADAVLAPRFVIPWRYYNPTDPLRGLSPLSAVRESVLIDTMSQRVAANTLKRGARPDFAIIAPEGLTRSEKEAIRREIMERHGGVDGWSEPIVLENGVMDIKPITLSQKEMEWTEQRRMARDEIAAAFGVPDEMMGYGRNTYENFGKAEEVFWRDTVLPQLRFRDDGLTRHFREYFPSLVRGLAFASDIEHVHALQESEDSRLERAERYFGMGVPYNAVAAALNLRVQDIPGGNVGFLPANLIPVTDAPMDEDWRDYASGEG